MIKIPTAYQDLLRDDTRAFVFLGTTMSDGSPQVTPVWFNEKDGYIYINSAKGRVKDHNLRERPQVALAIADPADPYRYLQIRGEVVEVIEEGAEDHIHQLSQKYRGKRYSLPTGQIRVIYKIEPKKVNTNK